MHRAYVGKRPFVRPRNRHEENTYTDFSENVNWIELDEHRVQLWALVNMVINPPFHTNGEFLGSLEIYWRSKNGVHHEASDIIMVAKPSIHAEKVQIICSLSLRTSLFLSLLWFMKQNETKKAVTTNKEIMEDVQKNALWFSFIDLCCHKTEHNNYNEFPPSLLLI
jgi:hypothetical protein